MRCIIIDINSDHYEKCNLVTYFMFLFNIGIKKPCKRVKARLQKFVNFGPLAVDVNKCLGQIKLLVSPYARARFSYKQ